MSSKETKKKLRRYNHGNIDVEYPENSCLFCEHCSDIFYDWDGPYAYGCRYGVDPNDPIQTAIFRYDEECEHFKEEQDET